MRLADRVFAPHYAAPMPCPLVRAAALRSGISADSPLLATLAAGTVFEVLEVAGAHVWGSAPELRLVGYVDATAVALPEENAAA